MIHKLQPTGENDSILKTEDVMKKVFEWIKDVKGKTKITMEEFEDLLLEYEQTQTL